MLAGFTPPDAGTTRWLDYTSSTGNIPSRRSQMTCPDWRIRSPEIPICNGSRGCLCQFNSLPGDIDANAAPIANPVTGARHRARVVLLDRFGTREAEFVSSHMPAAGPIPLDWTDGHSHIAMIDMTPAGPVN
jgi:hypothetical protein